MTMHEFDITMNFAGPFRTGGTMFLLLQPLDNHPWPGEEATE